MAGEERCGGYYTYGYDLDDVADCQSEIYGNLNYRTLPYSENRKEGAVPRDLLRKPRIRYLRVEILAENSSLLIKSETKRTGLTLTAIESTELQSGQSITLTTGLRLKSFEGRQARISESVLRPRNTEYIRIRPRRYAHSDHGRDIEVAMTNFGSTPCSIQPGECIAQILLLGVDDVECVQEQTGLPCVVTRPTTDEPFEAFAVPVAAITKSTNKKPWNAEWKVGDLRPQANTTPTLRYQSLVGYCSRSRHVS
jgi:dUTPase